VADVLAEETLDALAELLTPVEYPLGTPSGSVGVVGFFLLNGLTRFLAS